MFSSQLIPVSWTLLLFAAANQTIDQVKIFGSYVRWQQDMPPPSPDVPGRMALTTVDTAFIYSTCNLAGKATCHMAIG